MRTVLLHPEFGTSSATCLAALAHTLQGSHWTSTMPSENFDSAMYCEVKVSIPAKTMEMDGNGPSISHILCPIFETKIIKNLWDSGVDLQITWGDVLMSTDIDVLQPLK